MTVNLLLLGYFKYLIFILKSFDHLFSFSFSPGLTILIPLAISFFTFQQITFLVDASRGNTAEPKFLEYCLFVCFFPQLLSGPIVHHKEMLPQFAKPETFRFNFNNLVNGGVLFAIGLFKKVVIADGLREYVNPVFTMASEGSVITLFEALGGSISFTLQVYFDFSGYSDMALGCALMFGIRLPVNFYSPLKAPNRFYYWRHWHMTFARFMRTHVFLPLSHNKIYRMSTITVLFISLVLGGLWHGAGFTFMVWGFFHAFTLLINHYWRVFKRRMRIKSNNSNNYSLYGSIFLSFLVSTLAAIFFRAESLDGALIVLHGIFGLNGISFGYLGGYFGAMETIWILIILGVVFLLPNSNQLLEKEISFLYPGDKSKITRCSQWTESLINILEFRYNTRWAVYIGTLAAISMVMMTRAKPFIYFQF